MQQLAGTPPQFSLAKSHPGFGPTGPFAVTPDELDDRDDLAFASFLDGEPLQHGRTSQMIFPVAELVARISAVCPLLPGDLIFTGTPEGVGNRRTPPRFLQAGETLVSRLDGVGEIAPDLRPRPSRRVSQPVKVSDEGWAWSSGSQMSLLAERQPHPQGPARGQRSSTPSRAGWSGAPRSSSCSTS